MASNDRQERRLLRQRGAGTREIKNADFGFSFGPSNPPKAAPTPKQLDPKPSSRKTPRNRESGAASKRTPATTNARSARKTPATSKTTASATKTRRVTRGQNDTEALNGFDAVQEEAPPNGTAGPDVEDGDPDGIHPPVEAEQQTPNNQIRREVPAQHTPEQMVDQTVDAHQEDEGPKTLNKRTSLRSAKAKSTGKRYQVVPSEPLPAATTGRLSMGSLNLGKSRASIAESIVPLKSNMETTPKRKSLSMNGKENVSTTQKVPPSVERGRRRTRIPLEDLEEPIPESPNLAEPIPSLRLVPPLANPDEQNEPTVEDTPIEQHLSEALETPGHRLDLESENLAASNIQPPITTSPLFVTPGPKTPVRRPSTRKRTEQESSQAGSAAVHDARSGDELDDDFPRPRQHPPRQLLDAVLEDAVAPSPAMSAMSTFTDPSYEPESLYIPRKRRSDEMPPPQIPAKRRCVTVQVELQPPSREPSPDPVSIPPGTSIPITTHRLANPPASHPPTTAVTAPEVLAQVTSELTQRLLATHVATRQPATGPAAHARKTNVLRAFDSTLQTALFELADTAYASDVLESRLRRARADLALRREELMTVRRERERAALRMDEVRARFARAEKEREQRRDLVRGWERVGFALDQTQDEGTDTGHEVGERLSVRLRDVATRVCGKDDRSLLGKLKEFNGLLERAADVIEGRG